MEPIPDRDETHYSVQCGQNFSQKIMVKNMHPKPSWLPGKIMQTLRPVTYLVDVFDDHCWKCHIDQLKEGTDIPTNTIPTNTPTPLSQRTYTYRVIFCNHISRKLC